MGPLELLKSQHDEVKALFEMIRNAEGAERVGLCAKLAEDLTVHAHLEEGIFYPEAKARGIEDAAIHRCVVEHDEVKQLVSLLLRLPQNDPRLLETVARIEFLVTRHVDEEERHLFPRFEAHTGAERLASLGEAMERTKDDLRNQDILEIAEAHPMPPIS